MKQQETKRMVTEISRKKLHKHKMTYRITVVLKLILWNAYFSYHFLTIFILWRAYKGKTRMIKA